MTTVPDTVTAGGNDLATAAAWTVPEQRGTRAGTLAAGVNAPAHPSGDDAGHRGRERRQRWSWKKRVSTSQGIRSTAS